MKSRHYKKQNKKFVGKILILVSIFSVLLVGSFVTVMANMANTVECVVDDEGTVYEFTMVLPTPEAILEEAVKRGMPELNENDLFEAVDGNVTIKRAYSMTLSLYDEETELILYKNQSLEDVLNTNEIEYGENDFIKPSLSQIMSDGDTAEIKAYNPVTLIDGEESYSTVLYGGTVEDVLKELSIVLGQSDYVEPSLETALIKDMEIKVYRLFELEFTDGEEEPEIISTSAKTVEDFLKENNIEVNEGDELSHELDEEIGKDTKLSVGRASFEEKTETETVKYQTEYKNDSTMEVGQQVTETYGQNGEKTVVYKEKYINGEFDSKEAVEEKITKQPVTEVIRKGTMKVEVPESNEQDEPELEETPSDDTTDSDVSTVAPSGNTFTDMYGNVVSYSNVMNGSCTAYTAPGGITSTGQAAQVGIVAVDPNVIPYGTRMYITSGSVVYGYAVAGDTGGALMSGLVLVDVYYDTLEECYNFGRRDMTVYILD